MLNKIKIVHKGLTLVAVPLVFGIIFVSLLYGALSASNRIFQHELLVKDAMIAVDRTTRSIFSARICAVANYITKDSYFEDTFTDSMKDAAASYKYLHKLLKNERSLRLPLMMLRDEIVSSGRGYTMIMHAPFDLNMSDVFSMFGQMGVARFFTSSPSFSFMGKLQVVANQEANATLSAMNWIQVILIGGTISGVLIAVFLAIFFCLNITRRLLIIVNNTVCLSTGGTLSPPLKGSDEIAELDQFLFKSATEIRELERFKKEMIGVVSHELKSPLSSVGGFLSSLGSGVFGEVSDKARSRVDRTRVSVGRLMDLVKELLYLDRLELEMHPEQIAVTEFITASVDTVRELSERSSVEIVIKGAGDKVIADRNRLVQVVVNLLSNALKFSAPGSTVTIETRQNDGWLECRVTDQGRGIPEEFRKQIFEPFKQMDAKDATTKKGTGLGLTISRSIVEQHGGQIGVDSVEGEGSTFWFKIPACRAAGIVSQRAGAGQMLLSPAIAPSAKQPAGAAAVRPARFGILEQGLVIIAVPLIFQLAFTSVIGVLLYQVREQIYREQHSKAIVETMNRANQRFLLAANDGVLFVYSRDAAYQQSWLAGKQDALRLFERVKDLARADRLAAENVRGVEIWMGKIAALLDQMVSLDPAKELSSLRNLNAYIKKTGIAEQIKPLFGEQSFLDNLLSREKSIGKKLAAQRLKMIESVQVALLVGMILNIGLSTFLAFYLMRNVTSRLQHVMKNTARLVKRVELETPRKGSDEISYLDQTMYETGKRLIELEGFKRQLISIVSHELRTPLLSISSTLELLESGAMGDLSAKALSRLKMAQEEAERLIRLINDLLDIEKMEAGKFILDLSEVKVADLIESSLAAVASLAEMKQIALDRPATDFSWRVDRDRLCQVLVNLLSNAIKFSPEGETVKIEVLKEDLQLIFRISDQGRGIPEELAQKIFDRFVQVEKSDASERGGTGLGLAIARAIVEQHGGKIGVDSQPGAGSTFWFRLPADTGTARRSLPAPEAAAVTSLGGT
jgi:signal transduction histidine kinase